MTDLYDYHNGPNLGIEPCGGQPLNDKHINDGGPAFPESGPRGMAVGGEGMTLRDYFAAQAMQGLLANPGGPIQANGMSGWGWCNCTVEDVADFAWHIADAMIKAREGER